VLDSNQCISYLTIEIKGEIPAEWQSAVGERVYGCDVCQEVCPFNHKFAKPVCEPAFAPRPVLRNAEAGTLARRLLSMSPDEFAAVFKGSPMKRAKLRGLKRNSAVVLANQATDGPPATTASL
jgi:epoxyqueuosine reductase